jgi:hypothetical protein
VEGRLWFNSKGRPLSHLAVIDTISGMKRLLLALCFALPLCSQQLQTVIVQPDCVVNINFTAAGQTTPTAPNAGFNNIIGGCTTWTMQIAVSGFTGSPTVALESAPNVAGVPGSWVTFAGGTIISPSPNNVNPIVTTGTGFVWEVGSAAWVRAHFISATGSGTITGTLLGYRNPNASSNGTGGAASSVIVTGPLGYQVVAASLATVQNPYCPNTSITTLSGTGYNSLVAASGSTSIYLCNIAVTSASGGTPNVNTFSLAFGTCGSSPTEKLNLSGVTGYTDQFYGTLVGAASAALCFSESTANGDKVTVTYAQH